jgi:ABC-type Zn uptake system ZnuABC Zn-binding protein ZnuA
LRQIVRDKKVKALLVDANAHSTLAERISKEFRIPMVAFDSLETGAASPDAYEKVMRSNVNALTRALK